MLGFVKKHGANLCRHWGHHAQLVATNAIITYVWKATYQNISPCQLGRESCSYRGCFGDLSKLQLCCEQAQPSEENRLVKAVLS